MSAQTGMAAIGTYATANINATHSNAAAAKADIAVLIALIPNADTTSSSGAQGGGGATNSFLDEMSPAAAAQLRVELAALLAAF